MQASFCRLVSGAGMAPLPACCDGLQQAANPARGGTTTNPSLPARQRFGVPRAAGAAASG